MERTYKCPVCGKSFTDLGNLRACIASDEISIKKAEAAAEEARRKTEEARKKLEAEKAVQKQRYTDSIKTQRADIEKELNDLKVKIAAYNRLVAAAAQNAGVTAAPCSITVTFANINEAVENLGKEIADYFKGTCTCTRSAKTEDTDDLATIISKIIGI